MKISGKCLLTKNKQEREEGAAKKSSLCLVSLLHASLTNNRVFKLSRVAAMPSSRQRARTPQHLCPGGWLPESCIWGFVRSAPCGAPGQCHLRTFQGTQFAHKEGRDRCTQLQLLQLPGCAHTPWLGQRGSPPQSPPATSNTMHAYARIKLQKLSKLNLGRQHRLTRGHGGELNATLAQCMPARV